MTGQELEHENELNEGAIPLGGAKLLASYGKYADGSVVSHTDHRSMELKLQCVPHPYGTSTDPAYAGAICTTQRDILPEAGGDKIVTSEFLLLKTEGPTIAWRHPMNFLTVADGNEMDTGIQPGNPLLYRTGSKLLVVTPSTSPVLKVYEVALPNDSSVASVSN
jgi:hypothetical protein